MADDSRTTTGAGDQGNGRRATVPSLADDIEDMWRELVRERDEARARVAALEEQLARTSAPRRHAVPSIDLERLEVDPAFLEIIPAETARKHRVLPICVSRVFTIAMTDPSNQPAIDEIRARTGFLVQPVAASEPALEKALDYYYGPPGSTGGTGRPGTRGSLRLVWSRGAPPREDRGEGSCGVRPAG